jgi:hypothetical protein
MSTVLDFVQQCVTKEYFVQVCCTMIYPKLPSAKSHGRIICSPTHLYKVEPCFQIHYKLFEEVP